MDRDIEEIRMTPMVFGAMGVKYFYYAGGLRGYNFTHS